MKVLTRTGANDYTASRHGLGQPCPSVVANVGADAVLSKASRLRQSNVDISSEFSDLIVAQRAFEANSKTVTTFDSVTQQAINMIR